MDIFGEVESLRSDYENTVEIVSGLHHDPRKIINTTHFYNNSKYINGDEDELGREKPFRNILNFRATVAIRATDFDTKDIQVISEDTSDVVRSMLISHEVKKILKAGGYAKSFNDTGRTRVKFGGVLNKEVIVDGKLEMQIVDWRNVEFDPVNILENPIVEKHLLNRRKIAEKIGVWDDVDELLELVEDEGEVEVLEVTGQFPTEEDGNKYSEQLFILYIDGDKSMILHHETLKKSPYDYVDYEEMDGRSLGRGIFEEGEEAQVWTNDAVMMERDAMLIGGKVGFKTNDDGLENNAITDLDNGFILHLKDGKDFTQVNTLTNALPEFSRLLEQWDSQIERATSTYEAVTGETMPSGTPFRSVAIQNQEGNSTFKYRLEEFGTYIEGWINERIIPFAIKNIQREHYLTDEFSPEELKIIDKAFRNNIVNKDIIQRIVNDEDVNLDSLDEARVMAEEVLRRQGAIRDLSVPKDYFKDFRFKVSIITTGEKLNKAVAFESLANILSQIANTFDPATGKFAILENPVLSRIFGKIIELANVGISPAQLGIDASAKEPEQQVQIAPVDRQRKETIDVSA